ncbi:NUDIX hydrolase [Burkholderia sp. WAC0059]|uniref:NUDIX hydrolase n=1 Tax=Burkholderia sp. WAC0059 TaxID=2066022 RepID=UPI000C7EBE46|nr:NUDIX hydrolase [Burkholderia sp. WAC0059]PLZ03132.1 NUDIX hydrolase [Burkholderia sp. WAC0059]
MKDRATVVCWRDDRILLVARDRSRWALPGGTIRRAESPPDAARRELEEETGLLARELAYLFQFGGVNKRHHVFSVRLGADASPEPRNEISKCGWFGPTQIANLVTSVPTREIVRLAVLHASRGGAAAPTAADLPS